MNFSVDFCENAERFSAQFHEDDQSFDAFGRGVVLVNGKDGGYYKPEVTQPSENKLLFGFTPSDSVMPEIPKVEISLPGGNGDGASDHSKLTNRDAADQHTIEAITGLADALKDKLTKDDVDLVLAQAKESGEFDGKDGRDGSDGKDGTDGYTPVKGKDYYTEAEKAELVEEVLEQIPEQPSDGISVDKAEIGQTIVVKAVDENGKPTEWEAADMGGAAIIDVVELPTENIDKGAIYRLLTATFVEEKTPVEGFSVRCVSGLPEVGEPITTDMQGISAYYNIADDDVYGYVPALVGAQFGVPEGWYTFADLKPVLPFNYKGTIRFLEDYYVGIYLLLTRELFVYDGEWVKQVTSYEVPPIKIEWDGNIEGRDTFYRDKAPQSMYVKVSNQTLTYGQLHEKSRIVETTSPEGSDFLPADSLFAGSIVSSDNTNAGWCCYTTEGGAPIWLVISIHSAEKLQTSPDLTGTISNGTYFLSMGDTFVSMVQTAAKIKTDAMYLTSPNGTKFAITVSDDGTLTATAQ